MQPVSSEVPLTQPSHLEGFAKAGLRERDRVKGGLHGHGFGRPVLLNLNPAVGGTLFRHGVVPAKAGTHYA